MKFDFWNLWGWEKSNLELQKQNIEIIDVNNYFKYMLIEKWDGKSDLIISENLIRREQP
jgi:hypothetical protein